MRAFWVIASFFTAALTAAPSDPYLVSNKVQSDLDALLTRLIPVEQFLVQVHTEVATRSEKRLVEGETLVPPRAEARIQPVPAMPGFIPETEDKPERQPDPPTKQLYRLVEIPELRTLKVSVTFDSALKEPLPAQAKTLVRAYLQNNYPGIGMLAFATMPMLKPIVEPPREIAAEKKEPPPLPPPPPEKPPLSEVDILWNYMRWAAAALLVVITVLLLLARGGKQTTPQFAMPGIPGGFPAGFGGGYGASPTSLHDVLENGRSNRAARSNEEDESEEDEDVAIEKLRKKVLDRFIGRSQAFRQYFGQLSVEASQELYACLRGQAFNKLLDGLAIRAPKADKNTPTHILEILDQHDKDFGDFVHAKDWEDRQFFGFLHGLTDEQLAALVAGQTQEIACVLLRMMEPRQSAAVLNMMPEDQRAEILDGVKNLRKISFAQLVEIEKEVRAASQRLPDRYFGSQKEDLTFWGTVVSESTDQDTIVEGLVRSRPEIAGQLKKFRFRLEEAASLPDELLSRVLSQVDNEELCLAMATCSKDVREIFADALSDARRQVIADMYPSYRTAHKERTAAARQKLTKKIREAMG